MEQKAELEKTSLKKAALLDSEIEAIVEASQSPESAQLGVEFEAMPEKEASQEVHESPTRAPRPTPAPQPAAVEPLVQRVATPQTKSERLIEIEKVMSAGLEDLYGGLDGATQQTVKIEGEKAAGKIEKMIEGGKFAAGKILSVLRTWINHIPGVNIFYLEQESKIKTDNILAIARKTRGDG